MTATGNLLGTAVSGLLAYQRAMATTGHNVSNVNTPGYSRQNIELATRLPQESSAGFIGNGVNIDSIARSYDQFLTTTLRTTTSGQAQLGAYYEMSKQIDNLVADPQAGLSPALEEFFAAVQTASNDPNSSSARQLLLSQSNSLVNRFHYLSDRLDNLQASANAQLSTTVAQTNSLAQSIARINQQIYELEGTSGGQPPNDLLDQRDEAIRQLAERVSVTVVPQDNGMLNVFAGNGQGLVLANQSAALSVIPNEFDAQIMDIGYSFGGGNVANVTRNITGGKLGGVIEFRDGLLKTTMDQLGRVALGISETFNAQHRLGLDQNNTLGGDFFTTLDSQIAVASRSNNAATNITFTGSVTDVGALKASDYRIDFNAGLYTVVRLSDSAIVSSSASAAVNLTATEGFSIAAAITTAPVNGDSFLLQFTANAAHDTGLQVSQITQMALAGPLRSSALPTNQGKATITPGNVSNTTNLPLGAAITLTFNPNALGAGIPGFTVAGGPGGTLAYNPATESAGKTFTFASYGGYSFRVAGVPVNGDQLVIDNNTGGFGDNRNALALAALKTDPTLINGASGPTASLLGAYAQMVSDVGSRTHQAEIDNQSQQALLTQAQESWSNVSGVNLDEEAANLIKFQQAYQASAQVINAASLIFDTLLSAIRR